jgi:tryptophan-rich sensory protein
VFPHNKHVLNVYLINISLFCLNAFIVTGISVHVSSSEKCIYRSSDWPHFVSFFIIIIIIIIIILLQMGFSPVAVVQQVHNRQVNTNYTK